MFTIELDPTYEHQLNELARTRGQAGNELARRVLVDFLDFQTLPADSPEQWAAASVALAPEIIEPENWDE